MGFVIHTAICASCQSRVPMDLLPEHLSEHHDMGTEEIREAIDSAEVIDLTGEDDE